MQLWVSSADSLVELSFSPITAVAHPAAASSSSETQTHCRGRTPRIGAHLQSLDHSVRFPFPHGAEWLVSLPHHQHNNGHLPAQSR